MAYYGIVVPYESALQGGIRSTLKFLLHILNFFFITTRAGVPAIFVVGVIWWAWTTFFAQMDRGALAVADRAFTTNLSTYPGLGVAFLLILSFVIGLIGRVKFLGGSLSIGTAINLIARGKLKRVLSSPLIEAELFPGVHHRGWLVDVVRERVTLKSGEKEFRIFYYCYFPSANIPISGFAIRIVPEKIETWVLDRPSSRLVANIFSFGTSGNGWNRTEFDPLNFPPHNPKPD